jgi:hypothetical protein
MQGSKIRCVRCKGRKKMFFVNGGYTSVNMGAVEKDCPMCLGEGYIASLKQAIEEITQENSSYNKRKDLKHAEQAKEGEK